MSASRYMKPKSRVLRWLLIDTKMMLVDLMYFDTADIGAAWLKVVEASSAGMVPDLSDEVVRAIWSNVRPKQRTGRKAIPPSLRARIIARDGRVCRYCGGLARPLELDHVVPVSRGGEDAEGNLVVACKPCNLDKGAKLLSEWVH